MDLININNIMVTLTLNQQQVDALLGLLDIATKAGGIAVAEAAVFFAKSINSQQGGNGDSKPEK